MILHKLCTFVFVATISFLQQFWPCNAEGFGEQSGEEDICARVGGRGERKP